MRALPLRSVLAWRRSCRFRSIHTSGNAEVIPTIGNSKSNNIRRTLQIDGKDYRFDPKFTNVTPSILSHTLKALHLKPNHPIGILRGLIEEKLNSVEGAFQPFNNFHAVVTKFQNFDSLDFPQDHPSRSKSDTYYVNNEYLLRTHTSAHEMECFAEIAQPGSDKSAFLISADVYRRDEIDKTHYPVFYQMEGARVWKHGDITTMKHDLVLLKKKLESDQHATKLKCVSDAPALDPSENPKQSYMTNEEVELCSSHLKRSVELIITEVFNKKLQSIREDKNQDQTVIPTELKYRWVKAYFPWTTPSWEIEVWWQDEWLEICGCGVVQQQVLLNAGYERDSTMGWAFGLGLDRIAMLLFEIPDIRLLWTEDQRFQKQFQTGKITKFKPYSKYPGTIRDVSFWLPDVSSKSERDQVHENDIMEIVREIAKDLVESVKLVDSFTDPKSKRKSLCYRINYQSMDRNITNAEVNSLQDEVIKRLVDTYNIEIR